MRYLPILSCLCAVCSGATLVVAPAGGGDYTEIQLAIDAAAAEGDTVLVKPGEYVITVPITFRGKAITVRGEAGADATVIRMAEEPADPDRASVVIFESGETEASVLEGVTLTGGKGSLLSGSSSKFGGGVQCVGASPTLTNCTISGNSASWGGGGGVYCYQSSPTLTNCTISGNWARYGAGGGVYCYESSPTLTNCMISGNSAVLSEYASGGGVYCSGSSPTLTNCTISGNSAVGFGGGVYCSGSSPSLTNCTISGNSATGKSYGAGGGVYCGENASPTLTKCTISGNWARSGGGVYSISNSPPTLASCIVWGNAGGALMISETAAQPEVTFSCIEIEEGWPGEGNINTDPLFCGFAGPTEAFVDAASPEGGDGSAERPFRDLAAALEFSLSLKANSPCIRAGKDDVNIGADLGTCEAGEATERVLHVAGGRYSMEGLSLSQGASIVGAGPDETVLDGTVWGLRAGATLSGVTVVTGRANDGVVIGGGESPTLTNCTITNTFFGVDCGLCSSPTVTNCTITNSCRGVHCDSGASPTLTNCTISGNSATYGAGVYCGENSSPTLTDCTISGNSTVREDGGGVYCDSGSSATLTNCTISGNSALNGGGGVYCLYSCPTLTNCTISKNSAGNAGGGGVLSLHLSRRAQKNVIRPCENQHLW